MNRLAHGYEEPYPVKESPHKARMNKMVLDLKNHILNRNHEQIEKNLAELSRLLNPKVTCELHNMSC